MLKQDDYEDYEDYSADHAAWQRQQQQRVEDLGTAQAQDQANRRGSPQRREQRQQQPREPHGHMEVSAQSQHTLDAMHEDTPEPEPAQIGDYEVSTLEDLRDRYAIVTRPGYAIDPLDAPRRRIDARKAMAILCLDANQVPAVAHQPISDFVSCVVENQRPPRATVALSRKSLVDQKYRFEAKIINHSWLYDVWRYGLPRTGPRGLNDEVFHIVEKNPTSEPPYDIVVFNACDAVHAIYGASFTEWVTSTEALLYYLLGRGISFRTLGNIGSYAYPRQPPPVQQSLGYRGADYVFTVDDYNRYSEVKKELLASPHGRAAKLQGGILFRVAGDDVRNVDIANGPSYTSSTIHLANKGSQLMGDDLLTPEEIDTICGVYQVLTSKYQHNFCC